MTTEFQTHCECGEVKVNLLGKPRVKGICHCADCRELLNTPFHAVTAWNEEQITVIDNNHHLSEYQHPRLSMKRIYCSQCGETLYNTNAMDWRVVSQYLIKKCNDGVLPNELKPESHFYYGERIIDIDDDLPKHV